MVNVPKLKGIHYAIESGRLAAETIYQQLKAGSTDFSAYEDAVYESRHRQGALRVAQHEAAVRQGPDRGRRDRQRDGRSPRAASRAGTGPTHRDAEAPLLLTDRHKRYPKPDGKYTFDKLSGVFLTGNATRDDAPIHIRIEQRVPREVARGVAVDVPGGRLRGPRGRAGGGDWST